MDECDNRSLNECDQVCINSEPGYYCSCEVGFQIGVDGLTCSGLMKFHSVLV